MPIILASHSKYKKAQLESLALKFQCLDPGIQENHDNQLPPETLAIKLATEKAESLEKLHPNALIIGSDQLAAKPDGSLLTKPGNEKAARLQLMSCSNKEIFFHSAVCLIHLGQKTNWSVKTTVTFRSLTEEEINRYIEKDQPLDCAGSFKVESLGISLFEKVESLDPSALIGLPLISLASRLRNFGFSIP